MINKLCPKCGSSHVQLSNEETHHHGFFWWLFFGWYAWFVYICCKWTIGLTVFLFVRLQKGHEGTKLYLHNAR